MTIVITSKRDGFRRCGIAHPSKPTRYPDEFFTEEQLDALDKEPQLILAYAQDEFDQVEDGLHETEPQIMPPQTPGTLQVTEPQAPETIVTPVAGPVVIATHPDPGAEQSGLSIPGANGADSVGGDDLLTDDQDNQSGDGGDQSSDDQQDTTTDPVTPPKAKAVKAKAGKA